MKIDKLINLNGCLLCIFYTSRCWQYSILFSNGGILSPSEIYYTKDAAERVGREAIKKVLGR